MTMKTDSRAKYTMKLTEEEAFLIYSLRNGWARNPEVIYSLAGFPWTEEEKDRFINHPAQYEQGCKEKELAYYHEQCKKQKQKPDPEYISRINQRWDKLIEEKRQQSIDINDLQNAHYAEFLKELKEGRIQE